jgi:tetratricopeptide (TPR) repeat protein
LEARGLLCLVHKQLWPFSRQGAGDLNVVNEISRTTKQVDISSPYGDICESVKLFVNGKYREVRGLLATALELEHQFSLLPVLYFFKAEILEVDKDLVNSSAYYEQAGKIWEKWITPKFALANIYRRQGRVQDAASLLNWINKRNPKHKGAKIELGILWHKYFKDKDKAYNFLTGALGSSSKVSQELESEGYLSLAEIMLDKKDSKRARDYAQKGYTLNPNNMTIKQLYLRLGGNEKSVKDKKVNNELMFLGDQFARQGDNLAAQAEYKAAFEADPKNGTAAMRAAKCLWSLNQSFESIDWLRKAVKAEPKLIAAHVLLADYLGQKFDFEGARQVLANAITVEPGSYEVLKGLASMELRRNNIGAALTYAQKSLKIFDGDIETYIVLANANSAMANSTTPGNKKEIEMKEIAQRDALRFATKAIELDSTNAEAQIIYANILAQSSGIEMAISYLKEKIKKFSYSTEYRIGLAKLYQSEDRFAQAKDIYTDVVEADPKNKKAFIGLGLCNKALGLNDVALKNFLKAAVVDPSDGEALFHAGILYLELNRSNEAINQFQRVQKINPFFPKTNYYTGKAQFQLGNFKDALIAAQAEKKKNPELADSYILAAEVYEVQKQFAECAAEYSAAIKKKHSTSETFVRAAQCYRQSGSLDVSENMLEQALNLESGYAEIYKEQGALFEMRGDLRAAAASYNKYIGLAPNAKDRSEIEHKINSLAGGQ